MFFVRQEPNLLYNLQKKKSLQIRCCSYQKDALANPENRKIKSNALSEIGIMDQKRALIFSFLKGLRARTFIPPTLAE
jgi:hypothetical protein